jgi:hypothetical protein
MIDALFMVSFTPALKRREEEGVISNVFFSVIG